MVKIKRIYEAKESSDGYRVLVDRLWPRGISKEEASLDLWLKEIAPSDELRKWFNHDPAKWPEFKDCYQQEIKKSPALAQLKDLVKEHKVLTLLYGAKDDKHNQAIVLKETLNV